MIRRFGTPPSAETRYVLRPGAYAILRRGDDVLVTYQSKPYPEFQLPGGGIDPGESPIQALHREVHEETGWTITRPRRLGAFRRFTFMPEYEIWAEKLCTIYIASPARRLGPPLEPYHEAVWMDIREAQRRLGNSGDRHFANLMRV